MAHRDKNAAATGIFQSRIRLVRGCDFKKPNPVFRRWRRNRTNLSSRAGRMSFVVRIASRAMIPAFPVFLFVMLVMVRRDKHRGSGCPDLRASGSGRANEGLTGQQRRKAESREQQDQK